MSGERAEIISGITTNNPRRNWKKVAVLMMGLVLRQQQSNTQRRVESRHFIVVSTLNIKATPGHHKKFFKECFTSLRPSVHLTFT